MGMGIDIDIRIAIESPAVRPGDRPFAGGFAFRFDESAVMPGIPAIPGFAGLVGFFAGGFCCERAAADVRQTRLPASHHLQARITAGLRETMDV